MTAVDEAILPGADLTDADLLALVRELAAQPVERQRYGSLPPRRALAGGPGDQPIPAGVQNPFWEIVREIPGEQDFLGRGFEANAFWTDYSRDVMNRAYRAGLERSALCARYSWSIPSPGDVTWLAGQLDGQGVVEIGAGSGYWAWQLRQAGVDVVAYDPHPPGPENKFNQHRLYTDVLVGDDSAAANHPDRALMLCWPSYEDPFAKQALHAYQGDTVIYIGEGEGGCCADDRFHRILDRDFGEPEYSPWHVNWFGIHCYLRVSRRKAPETVTEEEV